MQNDDDRGPHERFEMYSRAGNDAVATMVQGVLAQAEERRLMRDEIVALLTKGIAEVDKTHGEVHDTEPQWAIVDEVNPWLDQHGFTKIDREDLF